MAEKVITSDIPTNKHENCEKNYQTVTQHQTPHSVQLTRSQVFCSQSEEIQSFSWKNKP